MKLPSSTSSFRETDRQVGTKYSENDNDNGFPARHLSSNRLAGYRPLTEVADHAKIDFDQASIDNMVLLGIIDDAVAVYEEGGYSQSIARLHLRNADPPRMAIPEGTSIVGNTERGDIVKGILIEDSVWNSDTDQVTLLVEYETAFNQTNFCRIVGGHVLSDYDELSGCFAKDGKIKILDFQDGAPVYEYDYSYQPVDDTYNGRTLQGFSTKIDESITNSKHFEKFFNYYGTSDYADRWIHAALNGTVTDFSKGNANFSNYEQEQRDQVLAVAPKVLNVWMQVVLTMEYAVSRCYVPCGVLGGDRCDVIPVRAWDQAVAFYSGSLEADGGEGEGVLLYDLADKMCTLFKTCSSEDGNTNEGTSVINTKIINLYAEGQLDILQRKCDEVQNVKDRIVDLMTVPLIQASLYSAHVRNFTNTFEEVQGATYAASILPIVHTCNKTDAETILENLGLGRSSGIVDIVAVKSAFENNYECLSISCEDIGGVWEDGNYGVYSAPCNYQVENDTSIQALLIGVIVLVCFIVVPLCLCGIFICWRKGLCHRHRQSSMEMDSVFHTRRGQQFTHELPEDVLVTVCID